MNDTYPLVSALCLAGRASKHDLLALIDCFRAQTYPHKELVIINNAGSQAQAASLVLKAEPYVFLIDTPQHLTSGMARNYGIAAANGQLIAQFDADHWHAPERLALQVASLAQHEAQVSLLARTLSYSYVSGRANYYDNERGAIPNTMLLLRPQGIDYPDIDKGEEVALLHRLGTANYKLISVQAPTACCRLYSAKRPLQPEDQNQVTPEEFELIQRIVASRDAG